MQIYVILTFFIIVVAFFRPNCNNNQIVYWGQNSYGAHHLEQPEVWERDLSYYCKNNDSVDVINLGFLNTFNAGTGLPELNLAHHCEDVFPSLRNKLLNCPEIGEDIKFCQSQGKTILLSLGGAIANTGFNNEKEAIGFAATLWNMFMEGQHSYRPFGNAIVNGIDLDLEGGSKFHYSSFLNQMQIYFKSSKKDYFVAAAPQCDFPDRILQTIMEQGHIDMISIQFYNNWCGVQNYNNSNAFNWKTWSNWARTKSYNKNVQLMLGVPAAPSAAGFGYVEFPELRKIISKLIKDPVFGGVMLWDVSQAEYNLLNNKPITLAIKDTLLKSGSCQENPKPTSEPITSSTTTRTSFTSTKTFTRTSSTSTKTFTRTSTRTMSPTSTKTSTNYKPSSTSTKTSITIPRTTSNSNTRSKTTLQPTKTSSSTVPDPTSQCPLPNQPCKSGVACIGNTFGICNNGFWVIRSCPLTTTCIMVKQQTYCLVPTSSKPQETCVVQNNLYSIKVN